MDTYKPDVKRLFWPMDTKFAVQSQLSFNKTKTLMMIINDRRRAFFSFLLITRPIAIFFFWLLASNAVLAQLTEPVPKNWGVNGSVLATTRIGNTLYLGGGFTMVGTPVQGGLIVDRYGNTVKDLFISSIVSTAVSDDAGGWFIGGDFSSVLGQTRIGLAHINADGTLSAWTANLEGSIPGYFSTAKIIKDGSKIFIGGNFGSVNGVPRNGLACVDAVTGAVSSWNPDVEGAVSEMALDGANVYFCGWFSKVGGQFRNALAAVSQSTGSVLTWNPAITGGGYISGLKLSGNTLYIAGGFSKIMGTTRNNAAAINTSTFTLTSWDPNPAGSVSNLLVNGSTVYLYGHFNTVRSSLSSTVARSYLAEVDATTGFATSFDFRANNPQSIIANFSGLFLEGGILYASAECFETSNPSIKTYLVGLDAATGAKISAPMNPGFGATFPVMVAGNTNNYFIGGNLQVKNATPRYGAAAIDLGSNTLLPWDPQLNVTPFSMASSGNTVYLGGYFSKVGADDRQGIAAVDAISGKATSWNHPINSGGNVRNLLIHSSTLYAGGAFATIDGQPRNNLASFDLNTGDLNNWNPNPDDEVLGLAVNGNTVYVGGSFRNIGGKPRNFLAAIDATTGDATSWNPDLNGGVNCLALDGSTLYAGGDFTSVNNMSIDRLSAVSYNIIDGNLLPWNPKVAGTVYAICPANDVVYLGGYIDEVGDQPRSGLAAVSAADGSLLGWNPKITGGVMKISLINNQMFTTGEIWKVNDKIWTGISIFDLPYALPLTWLKFTARKQQEQVVLQWQTAREMNTLDFLVQHSTNGMSWSTLDNVPASGNRAGTSNYNYLHKSPVPA